MTSTLWQLNDSIAQLSSDRFRAQLDLKSPNRGLFSLAYEKQSPTGSILGLHPAGNPTGLLGSVEDCYVRGNDFVAVFSQSEDQHQRTQVYWRHRPCAVAGHSAENSSGMEMVVSVQTDLLDSLPELESETRMSAQEVLHLNNPNDLTALPLQEDLVLRSGEGPCCIVVRPKDSPISYVEMEPDLDFREVHLEVRDGEVCLRHRLFSQRLEKGVILRARVHGIFVPRVTDLQCAAKYYEQLNQEELPLTT